MKNTIYDLIIIGAGPAGLSAGIYAGRAKQKILIIEKEKIVGGQIKTTNEVVNYPGILVSNGESLAQMMKEQAKNFGAEFINAFVLDIDLSGNIKKVETSLGEYSGTSILIATGGSPRSLGFPGEEKFKGRGVGYCATCDGEFFTNLEVFVVGAGFAAAEEAIFLTRFAKKVTVIAREPAFTCAETIADKVLTHPKIEVKFNTEVVELIGETHLEKAIFIDNIENKKWEFKPLPEDGMFGMFIFVGYKPETDIFKGKITLNPQGYVETDENMKTNVPGVYAAGDVRVKTLRQVVTAVSDGAIAAIDIEKYVTETKEKLGMIDEKPEKTLEISESFLTDEMKSKLAEIFKKMENEVTLVTIIDNSNESSLKLANILKEFNFLSDHLKIIEKLKGEDLELERKINADKYPIVAFLDEKLEYTGIKFHGIPGGHELNSFVMAILNCSSGIQKIDENLKEEVKKINKLVNLKVLVSLSCHICPEVVMNAQRLAVENKNIEVEMIDINLFPDIKAKYKIMSVPAIMKNDGDIIFGAKKIEDIFKFINKN